MPDIGDTVALDHPAGPCGIVAAINPATDPAAEALVRFADPARPDAWIIIARLVSPDYNYGMAG